MSSAAEEAVKELRAAASTQALRALVASTIARPLEESLRAEIEERAEKGHLTAMWDLAMAKAERDHPSKPKRELEGLALKDILLEYAGVASRRTRRIAFEAENESSFLRGKSEGVQLGAELADASPGE